jgi:NAD-dependent DNA ligase
VSEVLANGHITDEERSHLISTLQQLVGGTLEQLADSTHVTQLLPYETPSITYRSTSFCLTGDFACGPRGWCESRIAALGGEVKSNVSKKLNYLVVGGLGSPEWKHGSFGTKVEKAMELKREGASIFLVREEYWLTSSSA